MAKEDEFFIKPVFITFASILVTCNKKNTSWVTDIEVLVTKPLIFQLTTHHLRSKEPVYDYIFRIFICSFFSSICVAIREHCFRFLRSLRGGWNYCRLFNEPTCLLHGTWISSSSSVVVFCGTQREDNHPGRSDICAKERNAAEFGELQLHGKRQKSPQYWNTSCNSYCQVTYVSKKRASVSLFIRIILFCFVFCLFVFFCVALLSRTQPSSQPL